MSTERPPFRVLFVCWGNICRSPAGENVFRHVVAEGSQQVRIECDSAGTIDAHTGKAPDRRMRSTLEKRGIAVQGAARQITVDDFDTFDLILTMDNFNWSEVMAMTRNAADGHKMRRFTDFCRDHQETEVPDPYYGGSDGFEFVADLIEDGCRGLLDHIAASAD